jgi:Mrp family chromosome partitioning ATPase
LVCGDLHDEHPANVLAREEVRLMLDSLKQEYDFIVLDSSAIGKYSDVLIDGLEDITCYVCRPDKTPKTAFSELNHLAEEGRLLSPVIIVNHLDKA